eukprot:scaffold1741_cov262-Pinguiococcus_pyrenoidosus.AAC.24
MSLLLLILESWGRERPQIPFPELVAAEKLLCSSPAHGRLRRATVKSTDAGVLKVAASSFLLGKRTAGAGCSAALTLREVRSQRRRNQRAWRERQTESSAVRYGDSRTDPERLLLGSQEQLIPSGKTSERIRAVRGAAGKLRVAFTPPPQLGFRSDMKLTAVLLGLLGAVGAPFASAFVVRRERRNFNSAFGRLTSNLRRSRRPRAGMRHATLASWALSPSRRSRSWERPRTFATSPSSPTSTMARPRWWTQCCARAMSSVRTRRSRCAPSRLSGPQMSGYGDERFV